MLICRDGYEIAVVYFRCGYDPDNYELDTVGIIIKKTAWCNAQTKAETSQQTKNFERSKVLGSEIHVATLL